MISIRFLNENKLIIFIILLFYISIICFYDLVILYKLGKFELYASRLDLEIAFVKSTLKTNDIIDARYRALATLLCVDVAFCLHLKTLFLITNPIGWVMLFRTIFLPSQVTYPLSDSYEVICQFGFTLVGVEFGYKFIRFQEIGNPVLPGVDPVIPEFLHKILVAIS